MAKSRTRSSFTPKLISLAVASCFTAGTALANPTGANVVQGTAAIHQAGNLLQITNSPNAIINWQSFSIGANEITRFIQQSSSSAVLNRVVTQNPSQILGALQSNGRVFLINPNGILFGAGAQIDVGGLVASTLNMSDQDFLAGRMRFADGLGKSVVNEGSINTGAGGSVYLIGSGVANSGIIRSPQGEVVLAAGSSVELVSPGTPNLRVEIAALDNEARNLGQIISDAGRIGIYAGLINNSGTIRADSAVSEGGRIVLKATKNTTLESGSTTTANGTSGGSVTVQSGDTTLVSGTVEATGSEGKGGTVQVLGNLVGVIDNASLNASGETGGGAVLVGGDFQGRNPDVQNAFRTYFGPDATIKADAVTNGDGGKVIVWSDDATRAYGSISARGGALSGNGGFVEVSGRNWLDFRANVSTAAPNGTTGTLLLDPADVEIIEATLGSGQGCFGCGIGDILTSPGNSIFGAGLDISQITWGTIKNVLTQSNAIITTDGTSQTGALGNITVSDPSGDLNTSRNLQLIAHNNIIVNGKIENSFGDGQSNPTVALFAGWDGVSDPANPVITSGTGQIFLNAPISMTGVGGQVFLTAGNGITQAMTGPVTASGLLANGGAGNVDMQAANMVDMLAGGISGSAPGMTLSFVFNNAKLLTIAGTSGISVFNSGNGGSASVTLTGNGITVGSLVFAQGGSGSINGGTASVTLNGGAGGILVQGGTSQRFSFATTDQVQTQALVTEVVFVPFDGVVATGGNGGTAGGTATVVLSTTGGITVNNAFVGSSGGAAGQTGTGGNAQTTLITGGDIALASSVYAIGGTGAVNGTGRIDLVFLNSSGIYSVNGQANVIFDSTTNSGFFVDTGPAILNVNLFVTQGAPVFTDVLVATINQQADVLADQLKAGDTPGDTEDKEKKKLPFCSS